VAADARSAPGAFTWPSREVTECPFPFYEALRHETPVHHIPGTNEYLVSRHDDICSVAARTELFSSDFSKHHPPDGGQNVRNKPRVDVGGATRFAPYSMAGTDPPEHKEKRALGLRFLSRERLKTYEGLVEAMVGEVVDGWIDRGECDFRAEFGDILPVLVMADILGLPREDVPLFKRFGAREVPSAGAPYMSDAQMEIEASLYRESSEYMRAALLERVERPRDDFLSELIHAQIEQYDEFDLAYSIAEANTFLRAGISTTAHMLASAMLALCSDPALADRIRADGELAKPFVEEVLRLESPVQWSSRHCTADTEIGGVPIPRGALVLVMWASGNRDGARFDSAEELCPAREQVAKHQLAFGRGPHLCIGAPLARLEGQVAVRVLLARLRNIRLVEEESDLRHIESYYFRAPRRLQIAFDPA
jgi:cytochrome P450